MFKKTILLSISVAVILAMFPNQGAMAAGSVEIEPPDNPCDQFDFRSKPCTHRTNVETFAKSL